MGNLFIIANEFEVTFFLQEALKDNSSLNPNKTN